MISIEDAKNALDSMDDLCRMDLGVDPIGPRKVLEGFIQQGGTQPSYDLEESLLRGPLQDFATLLEDSEAMICGGAITSLFTNQPINDYDIYFRSAESFTKFVAGVLSKEYGFVNIVHMTDRSILITDNKNVKAQAIVYKFFPTPQDVFNDFDFTVNMGAYDFKTKSFVFGEDFFRHNSQRFLGINTKTAYPLISMLRVDKYRQRGYYTSKAQLLRLLLRVSQLELNSWDEVVDHIGGMYGIDPTKLFDRNKEFSLDEVIDQLGKIRKLETDDYIMSVDFKNFCDKLKSLVVPELHDLLVRNDSYSFYGKEDDELMNFLGGGNEEPASNSNAKPKLEDLEF